MGIFVSVTQQTSYRWILGWHFRVFPDIGGRLPWISRYLSKIRPTPFGAMVEKYMVPIEMAT
jgi:hypothetical protein